VKLEFPLKIIIGDTFHIHTSHIPNGFFYNVVVTAIPDIRKGAGCLAFWKARTSSSRMPTDAKTAPYCTRFKRGSGTAGSGFEPLDLHTLGAMRRKWFRVPCIGSFFLASKLPTCCYISGECVKRALFHRFYVISSTEIWHSVYSYVFTELGGSAWLGYFLDRTSLWRVLVPLPLSASNIKDLLSFGLSFLPTKLPCSRLHSFQFQFCGISAFIVQRVA
jgi:hypothetical protein